jgi:hypothetical protein
VVGLVTCPPFVLRQHQPPHGATRRLVLIEEALEDVKAAGHLLDQGGVEVEDHFAGDRGLLQVLRNDLQAASSIPSIHTHRH